MNIFLATLGIILLATGTVFTFIVPNLPQAQLVGVENQLEISSLRIEGGNTNNPSYSMTIKNLKDSSLSFTTLLEVTYDGITTDVYVPLTLLPLSIGGSESKEFKLSLKCKIYCNADGTYRSGIYRAFATFWKPSTETPICSTDPYAFECHYIQVAPPVSTTFTVVPPATQITFKTQACYQVSIQGGFVNCDVQVPSGEGSVSPTGTQTSVSGSTVTFTATAVEGKSKFTKWIKGDGCTNIINCKTTESIQNTFTSSVLESQIYTAVFEKIIPPPEPIKPIFTLTLTDPTACVTNPLAGVYTKTLNEKITIQITPSKSITLNEKSQVVFTITSYTIQKSNSPVPDVTNFNDGDPLYIGTKSNQVTKEITLDADTTVIISCVKNTIVDGNKPPDVIPGVSREGLAVVGIPLMLFGGAITAVSFFIGGRKIGV